MCYYNRNRSAANRLLQPVYKQKFTNKINVALLFSSGNGPADMLRASSSGFCFSWYSQSSGFASAAAAAAAPIAEERWCRRETTIRLPGGVVTSSLCSSAALSFCKLFPLYLLNILMCLGFWIQEDLYAATS